MREEGRERERRGERKGRERKEEGQCTGGGKEQQLREGGNVRVRSEEREWG